MSSSDVAESSRTASVRQTLLELRATKVARTNGTTSVKSKTVSVSMTQSSQGGPIPGFAGEDFIRFSDLDLSVDMPDEDLPAPSTAGKKRSAQDMESGYLNKKQETDAKSRHCPWAVDVDWEKCTNPAQMYDVVSRSTGLCANLFRQAS